MIEGTKPFRRKSATPVDVESSTTNANAAVNPAPTPDAANLAPPAVAPAEARAALGRRDWFRALVPAFGSGLVEILRTSNHLQHELNEKLDK